MRMSSRGIAELALLGAVSVVLGVILVWQLIPAIPSPRDERPSPVVISPQHVAAIEAAAFPPPEQFAEIAQRPLFVATRRPIAAPQPPPAAPAKPAPQLASIERFTVVGIVASPAGASALVKLDGGGEPIRLTIGQTLRGWKLVEIGPRRLTFSADGERKELELSVAGKSGAPAPAGMRQLAHPP